MCAHPKKSTLLIFGSLIALFLLIFIIRLTLGGDEDVWMCDHNKWISHGKPSYPKPQDPCGKKAPLPKDEGNCIKAGGVWRKMGPDPLKTCNMKAEDRGTICTDYSECEGWCQANSTREEVREGMKGKTKKGRGQCSVWRVELGCFGMVEKGIIKTICID